MSLRPIDLARTAGMSASSVRKYEALGFLPPAMRSASGRRRYTQLHLQALETARALYAGYSWPVALRIMQAVHAGDPEAALTLVDSCHADLHRRRQEINDTLTALEAAYNADVSSILRQRSRFRTPLRIGEAAKLAGVQISTIRFWEEQGLLRPARERSSGYRLYDGEQVRRLRVIALLRRAGYDAERIEPILDALGNQRPDQARAAIEQRREELSVQSRRALKAAAALAEYLEAFAQDQTYPSTQAKEEGANSALQ